MGIRLADTLEPMADFPSAYAKDIAFDDGDTLQEKLDTGSLGGGVGYKQLSQAEYDALTDDEKMDGREYRTYDTGHIYKLGVEYGKDGVQISDNETVKDKTWSSKKTSDEITKVETELKGNIEELSSNLGEKVDKSYVDDKIAQQDGIKQVFYTSSTFYPTIFWILSNDTSGVFWFKHTFSRDDTVKTVEGYADLTNDKVIITTNVGEVNTKISTDSISGKKGVVIRIIMMPGDVKITEARPLTATPTLITTR